MPATVGSILTDKGRDVWSVSPTTSVYDAARIMADRRVGALLVISPFGLVGIFSERDYASRVIVPSRDPRTTLVSEVMTSHVLCVNEEQTVHECMHLVTQRRLRHLPVIAGDRVVGVVSIGDLVKSVISDQVETIHYLEGYITGRYSA